MSPRNSDYIERRYTYSDRARKHARKKRHRKQVLMKRIIAFVAVVVLLIVLGKTVVTIKHKVFSKQTVSNQQEKPEETKKKEEIKKEKIEFTPIPSNATALSPDIVAVLNQKASADERIAGIVNNYKQYPEDLLELLSKNSETTDFLAKYLTEKDKPCADTIGEVTKGEIPHLLQWDTRWGYGIYGDNYIAINGCGPTALAMVAAGLTGDNTITPYKIAQYAADSGLYVPESGSSWDLMRTGANQFGITSRELMLDESAMERQLTAGHPIICSMRPGDFTTTGHFIVLTGYIDGKFQILDSNSKANSEKLWSYEQLSPQINNLWTFSI